MEKKFQSFCAFGAADKSGNAIALMDGAKLAKLCRDVKLLDKNLSSTDVDIIFSKVKAKTERKIMYKQFEEALKLMAEKKYPGDDDGLNKLKQQILDSQGPVAHGVTKAVKSRAVDRLTDVSKYTGSHKERFSEDGKGKGIAGRRDVPDGSGYVSGFKVTSSSSSSRPQSVSSDGGGSGAKTEEMTSQCGADNNQHTAQAE